MSQHEGISCDQCRRVGFRGKRFKCLACTDYDLCGTCYESAVVFSDTRHFSGHPMQCILARNDYEIFYGGEANLTEQVQSFTCPICCKMGFTDILLYDHVTQEHSETVSDVICPICCSVPSNEPSLITSYFASHMTLHHKLPRQNDEPQAPVRGRRAPHAARGINTNRVRRQIQISSNQVFSALTPASLNSNNSVQNNGNGSQNREGIDPIADLLCTLSGVRRSPGLMPNVNEFSYNQLQLQMERNLAASNNMRQLTERDFRRQQNANQPFGQPPDNISSNSSASFVVLMNPSSSSQQINNQGITPIGINPSNATSYSNSLNNRNSAISISPFVTNNASNNFTNCANTNEYLLLKCMKKKLTEAEQKDLEKFRKQRSLFVQGLILSSLADFPRKCVINDDSDKENELKIIDND